MNLSPQQQAVITWASQETGSLNLVARAGCGKTFTLMALTKHIVANGLGEVQLLAYNKSIAEEIKGKLSQAGIDWKQATAGTVHSVGFGAWRKANPGVKVDGNKVRDIVDNMAKMDPVTATRDCCQEYGQIVCKAVSMAKQQGFGFLTPVRDVNKWWDMFDHYGIGDTVNDDNDIGNIISVSIDVLEASFRMDKQVIDFDDMILAPLRGKVKIWPKDWVLLDEAQDTNATRRALALALLKPRTGRLVAVGDPAQAIYGFTGADSDAMDIIGEQLGSKMLPLNRTYRCPKAVVALAQGIVPDLEAMPEAPEGSHATILAKDLLTSALGQGDSILCRNTKPLIEQAYTLLRNSIPCYVEGREIGQGLVKLARRFRTQDLEVILDKLNDWSEKEMQRWMAKGKEQKAQQVEDQAQTLAVLIDKVRQDGGDTLSDLELFIDKLFGDTREGEKPKCVVLSTVHKAKGREWKRVYILDRAGLMPSKWAKRDWQIRQEMNLIYVAMTRAMDQLFDVVV